jgi:hypothetical protein
MNIIQKLRNLIFGKSKVVEAPTPVVVETPAVEETPVPEAPTASEDAATEE